MQGFTLIELAVVLVIVGLMTVGVLYFGGDFIDNAEKEAAARNMEAIDLAIITYVRANDRLPCPADIGLTETSSNFGWEAASPTQADADLCLNGTPDAVSLGSETIAGALPVHTLGIPQSIARDPWGNLIEYYVDRRMTKMDAFSTYEFSDGTVGDISVNDLGGSARTARAIYVILSHGFNQYGGFGLTGGRFTLGSANSSEQENYDFDGSTGDRIFVQGMPDASFDDFLTYRTRTRIRTVAAFGD
jgi:prepilin-type N-terminal cleavage/methylation domain-containing protein